MPETITKQEALKRLAQWMGWTPALHHEPEKLHGMWLIDDDGDRVYFRPFLSLDDAFELQARLNEPRREQFVRTINDDSDWFRWAWFCANATADQRTRAIVRVLWGCEVE